MNHFKFNVEKPIDWFDLQKEGIKSGEGFHTYAKHWRAKAAQGQRPLSEQDLVSVFLSTMVSPFYEHLIGVAPTDFTAFVQAGRRVEGWFENREDTLITTNSNPKSSWVLGRSRDKISSRVAQSKKGRVVIELNFVKSQREDKRKKWETKCLHPYQTLSRTYFLNFWPPTW